MKLNEKINLDVIRDLSREKNEPEWFLKKRLEAFKLFNETLTPNFRYGLNIRLNYDFNFENIIKESNLSQINLEVPSKKIVFETFDTSFKKEEKIMKEHLLKLIPENKFTLLNTCLLDKGFLIYIPANIKVKKPIKISSLLEGNSLFQHILIILGENARLNLIDESLSNESKDKQYYSKIVEVFLNESSELNYFNLQNLRNNVYNFNFKKASLQNKAKLNWHEFNLGSKLTYSETITELNGENAKTNNYGLFLGNEEQQFDISAKNIHNKPNTTSDMLTKGALFDKSKGIYRGLIKIDRNAPYSNGYQKEETLLLSNDAEADSIPELEIDNSEVRCTHGATVSHLDKDKMFYLMSRGLNEELARKELVKGFFNDLMKKIDLEEIEEIKNI
ncbi:MAG: Fe-S cluster assembly protein SufD, partial [Nanoarchaeota archaeon]